MKTFQRVALAAITGAALLASAACNQQTDSTGAGNAAAGEHWVPTWTTSPIPPGNNRFAPTPSFENVTLRQIVHTSVGGNQLRLRITNTFGSADLELGGAHLALRAEGAQIVPESDRALTFSGRPFITVPAGATVLSDPVSMAVPAFANLALSIYLPKETGPATTHATALETSYISEPGDHMAADALPVASEMSISAFLAGLEVAADPATKVVVAYGDSITDGAGSTVNANHRWPNFLARRLAERADGAPVAVANQGISGNRLLHNVAGRNAQARFDRDVLAWPGVTHLIVLIGINDIGFSEIPEGTFAPEIDTSPVTVEEMIAGYRQIIARAHAKGIKVIGGTLTPYLGATYASEAGEAKRQAVNAWIRESGEFDGVVDFDAAVRDPDQPGRMRVEFHSGDWLHPGDAGYAAMADAVDLGLFD